MPEGLARDVTSLQNASRRQLGGTQVSVRSFVAPGGATGAGAAAAHPLSVAELRPAKVVGDALLVATAGDVVAGEVQTLFGEADPARHWALRRCRFRAEVSLAGTSVLLAAAGGGNYYHWLFESLPRLRLLELAGWDHRQSDQFLLNQVPQAFHEQTLDLLGIVPEKRHRCAKARVLRCAHLIVPSPPAPLLEFPPWLCEYLRQSFLPAARPPPGGQRISVPRRRARRRRLANEAELEPLLRRAGFKTVCLEEFDFTGQVGLFASASVIAAIHGAGLSNLVFASPGARVIELYSPTHAVACYRNLAATVGLVHVPVVGQTAGRPRKRSVEDDLWIDASQLRPAFEQAGL